VLDTLFHALVRYAAPIIPFTAEEVWKSRYPDADSVHMLEWPEVDAGWKNPYFGYGYETLRSQRDEVLAEIEPMRRDKIIRSSLEADVSFPVASLSVNAEDFAELCIVSQIKDGGLEVEKTDNHKCGRCWRHLPEVTEDGELCDRCTDMLA